MYQQYTMYEMNSFKEKMLWHMKKSKFIFDAPTSILTFYFNKKKSLFHHYDIVLQCNSNVLQSVLFVTHWSFKMFSMAMVIKINQCVSSCRLMIAFILKVCLSQYQSSRGHKIAAGVSRRFFHYKRINTRVS